MRLRSPCSSSQWEVSAQCPCPGCIPLDKHLVSDQRTLFHIGREEGGRGGTGEERGEEVRIWIFACWLRPAGSFCGSPRRVEERSGAVSQASLNSPGEKWAWGEDRLRSEPAPLWKYLQRWLKSHVGETSVLTPRSHLTLSPFQCSWSYIFLQTWVRMVFGYLPNILPQP